MIDIRNYLDYRGFPHSLVDSDTLLECCRIRAVDLRERDEDIHYRT